MQPNTVVTCPKLVNPAGEFPSWTEAKAAVFRVEMTHACGGELVHNLLDHVFKSCPFAFNATIYSDFFLKKKGNKGN